jgi:hypothetical protein
MTPFWLLFWPCAAALAFGWIVRGDGIGWRYAVLMGAMAFVVVLLLEAVCA